MMKGTSPLTDVMSYAEAQLVAHDVACFCRALHFKQCLQNCTEGRLIAPCWLKVKRLLRDFCFSHGSELWTLQFVLSTQRHG